MQVVSSVLLLDRSETSTVIFKDTSSGSIPEKFSEKEIIRVIFCAEIYFRINSGPRTICATTSPAKIVVGRVSLIYP